VTDRFADVSKYDSCKSSDHDISDHIVDVRRAVSPVMALRLSRQFDNSSAFWLNAKNAFDLWHAERR